MYEAHFGLRESPFVAGHQSKFVYPSREHQEALAHLRYGIENREPFVLITGEVGTGKTTALYDVLAEWQGRAVIALITNSSLTRAELLEEIALRFGLTLSAPVSKPQAMVQIERHLLAVRARGERAILLLDEAQNLERDLLEEIRLLSNLEVHGDKLIQIFLVGQPELEDRLARPELRQLRQRIAVHYRLHPLGPEDTERYIHHRLSVAGGYAPALFPPESTREVFRITHGIPREINTVAGQAMLNAYVEGDRAVRPEHVRAAASETEFRSVLEEAERRAESAADLDDEGDVTPESFATAADRPVEGVAPAADPGAWDRWLQALASAPAPDPAATSEDVDAMTDVRFEDESAAGPAREAEPPRPPAEAPPPLAEPPRPAPASRASEPARPAPAEATRTPAPPPPARETPPPPRPSETPARTHAPPPRASEPPRTPAAAPPAAAARASAPPAPVARTVEPSAPRPASISPRLRSKLEAADDADEAPIGSRAPTRALLVALVVALVGVSGVLAYRFEAVPALNRAVDAMLGRSAPATPPDGAGASAAPAPIADSAVATRPAPPERAAEPTRAAAPPAEAAPRTSPPAREAQPDRAATQSAASERAGASAREPARPSASTAASDAAPSAPPAATSAPAPTPPPEPATLYALAVGTFLFEDVAAGERAKLATSTGLDGRVLTVREGSESLYRIVLGSFESRGAAERAASDLIARGLVDEARVVPMGRATP